MTTVDTDRFFDELAQAAAVEREPELAAIWTALLVEDMLGITLTDAQIDLAVLGDPATLRSLVPGPAVPG